jgi:acetyl-CoA acetyltransferase
MDDVVLGQHLQHALQSAEPQQQAAFVASEPRTLPIVTVFG